MWQEAAKRGHSGLQQLQRARFSLDVHEIAASGWDGDASQAPFAVQAFFGSYGRMPLVLYAIMYNAPLMSAKV